MASVRTAGAVVAGAATGEAAGVETTGAGPGPATVAGATDHVAAAKLIPKEAGPDVSPTVNSRLDAWLKFMTTQWSSSVSFEPSPTGSLTVSRFPATDATSAVVGVEDS